jgi:hypothetical protein
VLVVHAVEVSGGCAGNRGRVFAFGGLCFGEELSQGFGDLWG